MSKKLLGLDIRGEGISAVLMKTSIKGSWVDRFLYVPFAKNEEFNAGFRKALEQITREMDTAGCTCVISVPPHVVSYRNIEMPFKDQRKIRQVLPFELEPMVLPPAEEMIADFHPIHLSDGAGNSDVIAGVMTLTFLRSLMEIATEFRLEPKAISPAGFPLVLYLTALSETPQHLVILDIDAEYVTLFILISGQICLIRPIRLLPEEQNRMESMFNDIQHTISGFDEMKGLDFQPEEIWITGPTRREWETEKVELEKLAQILVKPIDLIQATHTSVKMHSELRQNSIQLDHGLALCLAEIEGLSMINFRRGPFALKKQWQEHKSSIIKTGAMAAVVLLSIFLNVFVDTMAMERKLTDLNQQIFSIFKSTFPDVQAIVDPLHQMKTKMDELKKTSLMPTESQSMIKSIDIINEISKFIPNQIDVEMNRMVIGEDNVTISGNTSTFNSVDEMKNSLEQSAIFKKVTITSANTERGGTRVEFKLRIQL